MSIIDRYILRAVLSYSALVLFVLLALAAFVQLIADLDDIGTGSYTLTAAIIYVAMRLPHVAFEILPIVGLIGALLGLGNLAAHSELIVMRSAGLSVWRLAVSVGIAGIILMFFAAALGELIAAPLEQYARQYQALKQNESVSISGSAWVKDGDLILNVEQMSGLGRYGGLYLFRLGPDRELRSIGRADAAGFDTEGQAQLGNYRETAFSAEGAVTRFERHARQRTQVGPEVLNLAVLKPGSLSIRSLYAYAQYLRSNELDTVRIELALWARITGIVSVSLMTLLALPFAFGSLRATGAGARIIIGVGIGLVYYLLNRTLANTGQVFDLDPAVVNSIPPLLVVAVTLIGLLRTR